VTRSSLGLAFLTSVAIHLGALMALSLAWGWLRVLPPSTGLDGTELVMVAPIAQPMEPEELAEIAPPPPALEEESTTVPSLPPVPSEPVPPPQLEPITPPKIIEQPAPKRVEPRPKPVPPPKPARVKKPSPDIANQAATGPRETPTGGTGGDSAPGPRLPLHDAARETSSGNVLGPSSAPRAEDGPLAPAEGGEAGAGNLFERGDVGVIPGAGIGGGSGARGRGGLGLGDSAGGAPVGGVQPGPGGEGSGEGGGSTSLPTGGYQVKPRYPDSARRRGIEGTVIVKAYVTEQGRVEQVQVEQSAGHADLDQAAVEAVGRWRFQPARRGRQPIAMWVSIPVKFMLNR
jgi:periplasmic protein TonB